MMSALPGLNQPVKTAFSWSSLFQLIASALAAFLLIGLAVIAVISGIITLNTPSGISGGSVNVNPTQSFMVAASLIFAGLLVLPSVWYSWKQIAHPGSEPVSRPEWKGFGLLLTAVVLILVVGALFLGNWASKNTTTAWIFLPPLNILATGLPALWLVYIGTHGLLPTSPKRKWGVFASGLVLGPFIILILELLLLVVVGILAFLWLMLDPNFSSQVNGLLPLLQNGSPDINTILRFMSPFLLKPAVIFLGFAFISVLVPLIEETLKPIGVWFLGGQKITPAMGFGYGVISGAGFGLFENLGNTSGGAAAWTQLALSRIPTLLIHCFTAGLVGWALASAWTERRYLRLGVAFICAILIHGLWNGMALLSIASSLSDEGLISISPFIQLLSKSSVVVIVALGVLVLVLFIGFNAVLRHTTQAPSAPPSGSIPPQTIQADSSPSGSAGETLLPELDINSSIPSSAENPQFSENDPSHQLSGDNPPTITGNNP